MEARVDSILVVGTDTTVGANLATYWTDEHVEVTRLGWSEPEDRSGASALESARRHLATIDPDRVVYCGAAAEPGWSNPSINAATESALRIWSRAVREIGCGFTYISSDAVFTGPWLFHTEEGTHHCGSLEAGRLRTMEELVIRVVPEALVVRTQAFGWSADGAGWIERMLEQMAEGRAAVDPVRHATPILATDLARVLSRAHEERAAGMLHVGGAERVSHELFARRLARQFGLPAPASQWKGGLSGPMTGFARGESSLRTNRVKNLLNLAMPMLGEGLERLASQVDDGYRERLRNELAELQYAA